MARWIQDTPGDIRQRSGFLFTPKTIGNETRWWEHATWEERLVQGDCRDYVESASNWVATQWVEAANGQE